jgi:hypothetical protein
MLATVQNHDPMSALRRIQDAGFTVTIENGGLAIVPASKITPKQRDFIRAHKPALMAALAQPESTEREPVTAVEALAALQNLTKPDIQTAPDRVCCAECRHSLLSPNTEPVYGWRSCGLDLPRGGGFGQALRRCEQWEAAP